MKETKKGSFKEELVNRYIEFIVEKCNVGGQLPGRTLLTRAWAPETNVAFVG